MKRNSRRGWLAFGLAGSQRAAEPATSCIVVLTAFSVVTGASIGLLVFPVLVLLVASAVLVPAAGRAGPT